VSTQTTRNTIPNTAKKEKRRIIGIRQLRFHEYQLDANCGKKGILEPEILSKFYLEVRKKLVFTLERPY
jgi:hypothetical protein